jgi:hypothetical protein
VAGRGSYEALGWELPDSVFLRGRVMYEDMSWRHKMYMYRID